jgi:hypothetical protein
MPGLSVSLSLRGFHVQLPGETTERDAVLVAKDTTIGLGFLQIVGRDGETPTGLAAVDLAKEGSVTPLAVGSDLYGVRRLAKAFDYAPMVLRATVSGHYEQPRSLLVLSGAFSGTESNGLLVYDATGKPAGAYVVQMSVDDATSAASVLEGLSGGIVGLDVVRASLNRSKKLVPAALEKAKAEGTKEGSEKPGAKPDEKPDEKPTEKPTEKPSEKPGGR